jgi:hypothetical protein
MFVLSVREEKEERGKMERRGAYLLHDACLSLAKGDVTTALFLDELDLDLTTASLFVVLLARATASTSILVVITVFVLERMLNG